MRTLKSGWLTAKKQCISALVFSLIGAISNVTCSAPAQAQSYSYLPYAIGSSLIYPLRYLGYSAFGNSGYNNGYGNAGFFGGSLLQQATRGYGGMGYGGYSPNGNPNFANVNSNAQGTVLQPNVIKYGGYQYGGQNGNQNANWNSNGNLNNNGNVNGNGTASANSNYSGYSNNGASGSAVDGTGNYSNSNYPATGAGAPQYQGAQSSMAQPTFGSPYGSYGAVQNRHNKVKNKNKSQKNASSSGSSAAGSQSATPQNQAGMMPGAGTTSSASAPFAVAFINNINTEYHGDIRKALANSQTRAWAQSLGVTYKENSSFAISDERSGLIEHVLKDGSLDPVSKLDTIKILLRN